MDFVRYSRTHPHFRSDRLPPLLADVARKGVIADVGCGDGAILSALHARGALGENSYAIDASPDRVAAAEAAVPGTTGVVADATRLPLEDGSVDGVVCSQVIEHVPDSRRLVAEIARVLRPDGWWYVGSVLRTPRAWWIYRRDGRWWLDPTHVREYESEQQFRAELEHPLLAVTATARSRFEFPLLELALRAAMALHLVPPRAYRTRHGGPSLSPPGYRLIEVAGRRLPG